MVWNASSPGQLQAAANDLWAAVDKLRALLPEAPEDKPATPADNGVRVRTRDLRILSQEAEDLAMRTTSYAAALGHRPPVQR